MKHIIWIGFICITLLLSYIYVVPLFLSKPAYVIGFPKEDSNGRTEMLLHYGIKNIATITNHTEESTDLSQHFHEGDQEDIVYRTIPDQAVTDHFEPLFGEDAASQTFGALQESFFDLLATLQETHPDNYPSVRIEDDTTITITTDQAEYHMDVSDVLADYGKTGNDFFNIDVQQATEDGFLLTLYFSSAKDQDVYHLIMPQDLSRIEVVDGERESYTEAIESGTLDQFLPILIKTDINDRYAALYGLDGIYDRQENKVVWIDINDRLSEDGKYVYINGEDAAFKKGIQRIQAADDYAQGNDTFIATFPIHPKQIAKQYGLKTLGGTTRAQPIYFNEDYIMYTFSFKGILFGSGGNVNVLVDLQNDRENPTMYVFDFSIS